MILSFEYNLQEQVLNNLQEQVLNNLFFWCRVNSAPQEILLMTDTYFLTFAYFGY